MFGRHTASDRLVSGAYKTEYGDNDDIERVMKRISVSKPEITGGFSNSLMVLRNVL